MAIITPVAAAVGDHPSAMGWTWSGFKTVDTETAVFVPGQNGAVGCIAVSGVFGGATVTLQGSVDNVNFYDITDVAGNKIFLTAAGIKDFSTASPFIRPNATGGSGDNLTAVVVIRR